MSIIRPSFRVKDYLGVPFLPHGRSRSGADCWGLVYILYQEVYSIGIRSYAGEVGDIHCPLQSGPVFDRHRRGGAWVRTARPVRGDLILWRAGKIPFHVAIFLSEKEMLHTIRGAEVQVMDYPSAAWPRHRIEGFYCHKSLVGI
tara:strand:- start:4679 stop:5110 length:432 start_codon:yes stop_codon:yes gene_type:complete